MDAGARGALAAPQPLRDLAVAEILDDPKLDGLAFAPSHLRQGAAQCLAVDLDVGELLDASGRLVIQRRHLKAQPPNSAALDVLMAKEVRELLGRDAIQPGGAGVAGVAEAATPLEGNGEGFGQQVGGDLRIEHTPVEVRQQRLCAPSTLPISASPAWSIQPPPRCRCPAR